MSLADVSRILAKTVDELEHTDIAEHALEKLADSRIREIHIIGRRGPAQAKFTSKELREFRDLADCDPFVDPEDLVLNAESEAELSEKSNVGSLKNVQLFREFSTRPSSGSKRIFFEFLKSPVELVGTNHIEAVRLEKKQAARGDVQADCPAVRGKSKNCIAVCSLRSIGYRGVPIPGVPFSEDRGVFPQSDGRILTGGSTVPGLYATGWIKRGPTGIIGTNRADAVATVESLLADLGSLERSPKPGMDGLKPLFMDRGIRTVDYSGWKKIDAVEIERGKPKGKTQRETDAERRDAGSSGPLVMQKHFLGLT